MVNSAQLVISHQSSQYQGRGKNERHGDCHSQPGLLGYLGTYTGGWRFPLPACFPIQNSRQRGQSRYFETPDVPEFGFELNVTRSRGHEAMGTPISRSTRRQSRIIQAIPHSPNLQQHGTPTLGPVILVASAATSILLLILYAHTNR